MRKGPGLAEGRAAGFQSSGWTPPPGVGSPFCSDNPLTTGTATWCWGSDFQRNTLPFLNVGPLTDPSEWSLTWVYRYPKISLFVSLQRSANRTITTVGCVSAFFCIVSALRSFLIECNSRHVWYPTFFSFCFSPNESQPNHRNFLF